MKSIENLSDFFNLDKNGFKEFKRPICCMDERTPFGIHAAGSGILLPESDFDIFMSRTNPDCLTSHDGCGAVEIFCMKNNLPLEDADKIAKEWTQKMAEKYGKKYYHISYSELAGSKDHHHARVCYFDATGRFNYSHPLPAGFAVNRMDMPVSSALSEVEESVGIIFTHGPEIFYSRKSFFVSCYR